MEKKFTTSITFLRDFYYNGSVNNIYIELENFYINYDLFLHLCRYYGDTYKQLLKRTLQQIRNFEANFCSDTE